MTARLSVLILTLMMSGFSFSYNMGSGMVVHVQYICSSGLSSDSQSYFVTHAYDSNQSIKFLDSEISEIENSCLQLNIQTDIQNFAECPLSAHRPSEYISSTSKTDVVYFARNNTCTINNAFVYGSYVPQRYIVCPVGMHPDPWYTECLNQPVDCSNFSGSTVSFSHAGNQLFDLSYCQEVAPNLFCEFVPMDGLDEFVGVLDNGDGTQTSYSGTYEITLNQCSPQGQDSGIEKSTIGKAPDGCIVGATGAMLCLDENGGSQMVAFDDEGNQVPADDSSICLEINGTFQCIVVESDKPGCGYVNGEYACYGSDGKPIDPDSPDHPQNGGNADGNNGNDVLDPTNPDDVISQFEQSKLEAEDIGQAVGSSVNPMLDGSMDSDDVDIVEDAITTGLARDENTGEFVTQDVEAQEQIDALGDFNNLIDLSDEKGRFERAVKNALPFFEPVCTEYRHTLFQSIPFMTYDLVINCHQTEYFRSVMQYLLWCMLIVYVFKRITSIQFGE